MLELPEAVSISRQINETLRVRRVCSVPAGQRPRKYTWYCGDPQKYGILRNGFHIDGAQPCDGQVEMQNALYDPALQFAYAVRMCLALRGAVHITHLAGGLFHHGSRPPPMCRICTNGDRIIRFPRGKQKCRRTDKTTAFPVRYLPCRNLHNIEKASAELDLALGGLNFATYPPDNDCCFLYADVSAIIICMIQSSIGNGAVNTGKKRIHM